MTRDEARDTDNVVEIGDLQFLLDGEMERTLRSYGGLMVGYRTNPWGGGLTLAFGGGGGGCC